MLWADLVYELKVYLDNWLESVEVNDFEGLKELMLTEQVKKRAPLEIRQHYLDVWEDFKTASVLAEKCDKYEVLTRDTRRLEFRNNIKKPFERTREKYVVLANRDSKFKNHERAKSDPMKREVEERKREINFDTPRAIKCYNCGKEGHIRPNCPTFERRDANVVNNLGTESFGRMLRAIFKESSYK